jgi:hypothetical protein
MAAGLAALLVPLVPLAGSAEAAAAPAPSVTAKKLLSAWLRGDRAAARKVATPSSVKTIFAYPYRAPDQFAGCAGKACRFVHTSVHVPGGLGGILMIVSGGQVTRVYESRFITKPATVAKYLFKAWQVGDRYRGLEVASKGAVKTLFRTRFGGVGYTFQGCNAEKGGQGCAYSYEGGAMFMHLTRASAHAGYGVKKITYIAD